MSAVSRVEGALQMAHRTQDAINAFTEIDDEGALARAGDIDRELESGKEVGPLTGVPVALKDLIDHRGHVTTCGSAFYRHRATTTAPCVGRLEAAGAIIIGRTGLHEWAFGFSSENPHWGPVRNPWDPTTSTGGSSGGSAAAVASGVTPIAIGTDTGGSVRVPAALCGTFGLKVTYGRIPLDGVFPLVGSIDTVGPLANSMENVELSYRAMSGDETPEPEPKAYRLAIPQPWYDQSPIADDIAVAFEETVAALQGLGHEVHPIDMPGVNPSIELWNAIAPEVRSVHAKFRGEGKPYGPDVAKRLDDADPVTEDEVIAAREWQAMIRDRFRDAFGPVDFLITPSVPVRRKVIGEDRIGGRHYRAIVSYFTALVNHSLHPALALPLAGSGTPPASLQVIGPMHSEIGLISLGRHLEASGLVEYKVARISSGTAERE